MNTTALQKALKDEQTQATAAEAAARTVSLAHSRQITLAHAYAQNLRHLALSQNGTPGDAGRLMSENAWLITEWRNTMRREQAGPLGPGTDAWVTAAAAALVSEKFG